MAHADLIADRIVVDTQWNERELIKQIPGARWDATAKHWHLNATWTSCVMLRGVFGPALTIGDDLTAWAWDRKNHVDRMMEMRTWIEPMGWEDDRGLYPFQAVGSRFLRRASEVLLGDEMGTGKTIQALAATDDIGAESLPVLVVCPNSVKTHWAREVEKWTIWHPYVVTGGSIGRKKIIEEAAKDPHAVVIVNIEALRLLTRLAPYGSTRLKRCRECDKTNGEATLRASQCEVHPKELNKIAFKTVIIDEAHRIKNPQSKQTRAVWAVAHQPSVVYRWALTGTPLANHPGDLWSILHAISPVDFPTKTHFVDRYCLQSWSPFGGLDIVGINPATRDEFFQLLDPRFRRMPKALVLSQLPAKIRSVRWVDMSTSQAKHYRELVNGLGTLTPGGPLIATNQLTARVRLMQFASSSVNVNRNGSDDLDDWEVDIVEPSPKLDELENVLEEMGDRPAVICAQSRKLIELAARRFDKKKLSYGLITGAVSEYERQLTLEAFQAGKLRYLLFTIQAGGTGLTMTASDTIIFLQRSDSMIGNKQAEDRVHRIGSERHESIHVIDIVARDTVEERQIELLTEKFLRLEEITRDRLTIETQNNDYAVRALDEEEERIMAVRL